MKIIKNLNGEKSSSESYSIDLRDLWHDEKGVSNDRYDFLQACFKEHPEYAKNKYKSNHALRNGVTALDL